MKAKATKATIDARTSDLTRIVLDGALWPLDLCEYVREKEKEVGSAWFLAADEKPLSYSQIRRYVVRAEKVIAESCRTSRKRLIRRHIAQRRNLYARAVATGDIKAALAVLRDEAELLNLYPDPASDLKKQVDELAKQLDELDKAEGRGVHSRGGTR